MKTIKITHAKKVALAGGAAIVATALSIGSCKLPRRHSPVRMASIICGLGASVSAFTHGSGGGAGAGVSAFVHSLQHNPTGAP